MKQTIIPLLIAFGIKAQRDNSDNLHYLAGVNIASGIGAAYFVYKPYKPFKACLVGLMAGSLAGLGKELYDMRKGGTGFNKADLTTTIWGSLVGSVCLRVGIHEVYGKKRTIAYNLMEN